jgi:hypothetical protein
VIPFSKIKTKVRRAVHHLNEVEMLLAAYKNTEPYAVTTEIDHEKNRVLYYVCQADEVPPTIALAAGDVLQNLRSALDHLAWELVVAAGNEPDANTAFPISANEMKYENNKLQKMNGMSQDAMDAIDALKPYKGGNDTLWRIHALNNIDKHRLLLTVGGSFRAFDIASHSNHLAEKIFGKMQSMAPPRVINPGGSFPLKVGDVLLESHGTVEVDPKTVEFFGIEVVFGENGIVEGEPVLSTLQGMMATVESIVNEFAPLLGVSRDAIRLLQQKQELMSRFEEAIRTAGPGFFYFSLVMQSDTGTTVLNSFYPKPIFEKWMHKSLEAGERAIGIIGVPVSGNPTVYAKPLVEDAGIADYLGALAIETSKSMENGSYVEWLSRSMPEGHVSPP